MKNIEYNSILNAFKSEGYTLLSKECPSSKSFLKYRCPRGHIDKIRWNKFQQGRRCAKCSGKKRKTLSEVIQAFSAEEYTVVSTTYKNSRTPIKFVCKKAHVHSICWDNFKSGQRCSKCYKERLGTIKSVSKEIESAGFKILDGLETPGSLVNCLCPKGHPTRLSITQLRSGWVCCSSCSGKKKRTLEEVRQFFESKGFSLLSTNYRNGKQKLKYKCPKGHLGYINWNNFSQGQRCSECAKISTVSRVSQKWLDSLGIEQREVKIGCFRVDGFDPKTNTVYEFLGDYWHGNPEVFSSGKNLHNNKSFVFLFRDTCNKLNKLKAAKYNVIYLWENDFNSEVLNTRVFDGNLEY